MNHRGYPQKARNDSVFAADNLAFPCSFLSAFLKNKARFPIPCQGNIPALTGIGEGRGPFAWTPKTSPSRVHGVFRARQAQRNPIMGQIVTVNFRGDQLYGFENDDGVFVALKPIVESMGMDWSAQYRRVQRDPILKEGIAIMATPFGRGGDQEAVCLKFDLVNGWLFTIDSSRIKDEAVREKVILYQRECHDVLFKHFYKGAKPASEHLVIEDHEETANPDGSKVRLVTECRQTFGVKASGQLWFQLGLPTVPAMIEQSAQYSLLDFAAIKTADQSKAA